ncbi:MAG: FIST N-terminal domain-containing protein [Sneathiellaceae bacterium]
MTELRSFAAEGADTASVLNRLQDDIQRAAIDPCFAAIFYGCSHDDEAIRSRIGQLWPRAAVIGGTSCSGVMTGAGNLGAQAIGVLAIDDPAGDYGVAAGELAGDAAAAAAALLRQALRDADCPGELPELIWIYQAPGREEEVIAGLRQVVGDRCPIIGGSSADDDVAGNWRQLGRDAVYRDGLAVAALFPSGGVGHAFQGGYQPAGALGIVTSVVDDAAAGTYGRARRGRRIRTIDHQPAAEVYNIWVGNRLAPKLRGGGNILVDTTVCPLGIEAGRIEGMPHYRLVHPDSIAPDGSITTFAVVEEGARIHAMRGDKRRLVDRAGRVATAAASGLSGGKARLAGGLMVYCAGCKIAVGDQMPEVAEEVRNSFGGQPFIGCFTFGEQGNMFDQNIHANLMISAIAFGR